MGLSCSMCVVDVYVVTDLQTRYIMKITKICFVNSKCLHKDLQTFTLVYYISEVTWRISHKMLDQSRYTKEEHTLQKWPCLTWEVHVYFVIPSHLICLVYSSLFYCLCSQLSSGDFVHPLLLTPTGDLLNLNCSKGTFSWKADHNINEYSTCLHTHTSEQTLWWQKCSRDMFVLEVKMKHLTQFLSYSYIRNGKEPPF